MVSHNITVIPGDGIGPEVMSVALKIITAFGIKINIEECEAGEKVFAKGNKTGLPSDTIDSIQRTGIALKGPLATPVGHGGKSVNVTLRKLFETYGNIRPAKELPSVETPFSGRGIDLLVVRENVEDLYAGIEHMQTPSVAQSLKVISRLGCEKIVRLAFELARSEGRKKIHCATKANIMKLTEGMLKQTFEEIAQEYSDIQAEHIIVDNLAHLLVIKPESFDVIVATNMNGDIISDLTSGLIGGLGFAPSANIGDNVAIFEAVHGSAPDIAGKNIANPTALILSSTMLLRYLNEIVAAETIENALLVTLEQGKVCTADIKRSGARVVGTNEFGEAIIANFGKAPKNGKVSNLKVFTVPRIDPSHTFKVEGLVRDIGIDVFIQAETSVSQLSDTLKPIAEVVGLKLTMISNRGTAVYPLTDLTIDCIDHWRCRFITSDNSPITSVQINNLLEKISIIYRWCQLEKLMEINGQMGFSLSQGES